MIEPSVCPSDCRDTRSLEVTPDNGEITLIGRSRANPCTAGAICGDDDSKLIHSEIDPGNARLPGYRPGEIPLDAELKTDIQDGACYNETFVDLRRV